MTKEKDLTWVQLVGLRTVSFGKYKGVKIKDLPESYLMFVLDHHEKRKHNEDIIDYAYMLRRAKKDNYRPVYLNNTDSMPDHLICTKCNERVERGIENVLEHFNVCEKRNYMFKV